MLRKWFLDTLEKVRKYNEYPKNYLTVAKCNKLGKSGSWTPCDLIIREYLNNGGGSSLGFLGITTRECEKCYKYMCENKNEIIAKNLVNCVGYNNWGIELWRNYQFAL